MPGFLQSVDENMVLFAAEHLRFGALDAIAKVITILGDFGFIWILCGVILILNKKNRRRGAAVLLCLALCAVVTNLVLKSIIARPRPYEVLPELTILIKPPGGYSLPSGHAASSFAAAFALTKGFGKRGAWAYIFASMIALSRVYAGVHFLSDIIAGAIVGTVCAWTVYKAFGRRLN